MVVHLMVVHLMVLQRRLVMARATLFILITMVFTSTFAQGLTLPPLQQRERLEGELNDIASLLFVEDPPLLVTAGQVQQGAAIEAWNLTTGNLLRRFDENRTHALAYSPTRGSLATAGHDGGLRLWQVIRGDLQQTLGEGTQRFEAVAFSPDESLLAVGRRDGSIVLWHVDSGGMVHVLEGHSDTVRDLAFTPDGSTLVSVAGGDRGGGDTTMRLWDVTQGNLLQIYEDSESTLWDVTLNTAGDVIMAGNNGGQVLIWRLAFGVAELVRAIDVHERAINDLAIHPSGGFLVTASSDESLKMVDVATGVVLLTLPFAGSVQAVGFDAAGRVMAAAGRGNVVQLWQFQDAE
jgi:WD40 repeat protein